MSSSRRGESHHQSTRMALSGMLVALSVVLMLTGGLIPVMTYVSPLLAGLLLLPLLLEFGAATAWTAWGAAALVVLLLGIDREAAFFYLFFGYYPIIKWRLDKLRGKGLRLLCKSALFAVSAGVMYALLAFVIRLDAVLADFGEMGVWMTAAFFALLVVCMLLYDRLLFPLLMLYDTKLRPRLHLK